jgi:hypothetical protein
MVKAPELSDVAPLISEQDVLGEGGPFVDPVCAEAPASFVSRLMTYAFAGGMILLAPFLILSLAAAFVVACLRLQGGDEGQEASMVDQSASTGPVEENQVLRKVHLPGERPINRWASTVGLADAHRWN